MQRPMAHNREDPLTAPKYPQNHIGNYIGKFRGWTLAIFKLYRISVTNS